MATTNHVESVTDQYLSLTGGGRQIDMPNLVFEKNRWSDVNRASRENLMTMFEGQPNLVKEFIDPRFGEDSFVLLRKEVFEKMYRLLKDLESGQVALQTDFEAVYAQTRGLSQIVQGTNSEQKKILVDLVSVLETLVVQAKSRFTIVRDRQVYPIEALSDEEMSELDPEDFED